MRQLQIRFAIDSAAFEDDGAEGAIEAGRILRRLAAEIEDCGLPGKRGSAAYGLRDQNGNTVGFAECKHTTSKREAVRP